MMGIVLKGPFGCRAIQVAISMTALVGIPLLVSDSTVTGKDKIQIER
jgi:hypothetical protein